MNREKAKDRLLVLMVILAAIVIGTVFVNVWRYLLPRHPIRDLGHGPAVQHGSGSQDSLLHEHVYGGLPSDDPVVVRNGYVLSYDPVHRVPAWVAYHIKPDYLKTPKRSGKYASFRRDPDVAGDVSPSDYKGSGYDRGHLAPYFAMGGDRDGDGLYAADGDPDDQLVVFEANRMGNIAPQHREFNRSGGVWHQLETWVREELVRRQGREVWVFAGCVFGPGDFDRIGNGEAIHVPPMFFKILLYIRDSEQPTVLAFLFPHQQVARPRTREQAFPHFLVSVDLVETMTGLDFFQGVVGEEAMESEDTWGNWDHRSNQP